MNDIQPLANKPGMFLVPKSNGRGYHEVCARSGACDCEDWAWRHSHDYSLCRHGKALKAHLEALKACPQCGGRGWYAPHFIGYASGNAPVPCTTCGGEGTREAADPHLASMWDQAAADASDAELKALFR